MNNCDSQLLFNYDRYHLTALLIGGLDYLAGEKDFEIMGLEVKLYKQSSNAPITPDVIIKYGEDYYLVEIKASLPHTKDHLIKKITDLSKYCDNLHVGKDRDFSFKPKIVLFCESSSWPFLSSVLNDVLKEIELGCDFFIIEWSQKYSVRHSSEVIYMRKVFGSDSDPFSRIFNLGVEVPVDEIEILKLEKGRILPLKPPIIYLVDFLWGIIFPAKSETEDDKLICEITIDEIIDMIRQNYNYFFNLGEWTDKSIKKSWIKEAMFALNIMGLANPVDKKDPIFANKFKINLSKLKEKNRKKYFAEKICKYDIPKLLKKKKKLIERNTTLDQFLSKSEK